MSTTFHHESTRVPVTALVFTDSLLFAGEGSFVRVFDTVESKWILSARVFTAQTVHGILVYAVKDGRKIQLVIWGGRLVCAMRICFLTKVWQEHNFETSLSNTARAPDWILDMAARPCAPADENKSREKSCVAVTAHNALLQVTVDWNEAHASANITSSISKLTSNSRSILYSAHLLWESPNHLLIAAGTAFGEVLYWSWTHKPDDTSASCLHCLFLGHEGSIFGVQISQKLPSERYRGLQRVIASCSDDRTIRIWDVSNINTVDVAKVDEDHELFPQSISHTGLDMDASDSHPSTISSCLAVGWGHLSRVWTVHFMNPSLSDKRLVLLSTGEDATACAWQLVPDEREQTKTPFNLLLLRHAAHHSGKNIWSCAFRVCSPGSYNMVCGGADSKITAHSLMLTLPNTDVEAFSTVARYTTEDIVSLAEPAAALGEKVPVDARGRKADYIRSYCFMDASTLFVVTNSGKVLVSLLHSECMPHNTNRLSSVSLITQLEDLNGYSLCASSPTSSLAFVASAKGTIYTYSQSTKALKRIHSLKGKVEEMLTSKSSTVCGQELTAVLVSLVGVAEALLLYVKTNPDIDLWSIQTVSTSDPPTSSIITSMTFAESCHISYLFLGFRCGSIASYRLSEDKPESDKVMMNRIIKDAHGGEAVTCLIWYSSSEASPNGYLLSVGRDGRLTVHFVNLAENIMQLFHQLSLPFGPNIEGLYFHEQHVLVHGFRSKNWILYDVTLEEEIMNVETGGARRTWAFQPFLNQQGGTLVWTRATGLHVCTQARPDHITFRSGSHGREIKAVAVAAPVTSQSLPGHRVATGAEDTDIKIFQYLKEDFTCQTTIRKHTTGIQHLQWSTNADYLFSSGGCEEFYVWRIRDLPSFLGTGVVCEHAYSPESEYADLRIMSFDVMRRDDGVHIIAMVFSDSSLKVYGYDPDNTIRWQPLAKGIYSTSCLTQCLLLSADSIFTAGTDGYTMIWPVHRQMQHHSANLSYKTDVLFGEQATRIHQNSSKVIASHNQGHTMLVVSGGDDGSLGFSLACTASSRFLSPPVLLQRAHASAVTACTIVEQNQRLLVLTSGNDQWLKMWEVVFSKAIKRSGKEETRLVEGSLDVIRHNKVKTDIADVSCMTTLNSEQDKLSTRILLCGVGMEVVRVEHRP